MNNIAALRAIILHARENMWVKFVLKYYRCDDLQETSSQRIEKRWTNHRIISKPERSSVCGHRFSFVTSNALAWSGYDFCRFGAKSFSPPPLHHNVSRTWRCLDVVLMCFKLVGGQKMSSPNNSQSFSWVNRLIYVSALSNHEIVQLGSPSLTEYVAPITLVCVVKR